MHWVCRHTQWNSRSSEHKHSIHVHVPKCMAGNFLMVLNFAIFADRSTATKIRTTKFWTSGEIVTSKMRKCAKTRKLKLRNFVSKDWQAIPRNFALAKKFPLYGNISHTRCMRNTHNGPGHTSSLPQARLELDVGWWTATSSPSTPTEPSTNTNTHIHTKKKDSWLHP